MGQRMPKMQEERPQCKGVPTEIPQRGSRKRRREGIPIPTGRRRTGSKLERAPMAGRSIHGPTRKGLDNGLWHRARGSRSHSIHVPRGRQGQWILCVMQCGTDQRDVRDRRPICTICPETRPDVPGPGRSKATANVGGKGHPAEMQGNQE